MRNKALESLYQVLDTKLRDSLIRTFQLAIYAGLYIGLGGILFTLVTSLNGHTQLLRFIGALLFCVGLILIIFRKAQLFTGNNLMLAFFIQKRIKSFALLKNWTIVYIGNLFGALIAVFTVYHIFKLIAPLSIHAFKIAELKTSYSFFEAFIKAIYCNMLVCLAVYLAVTSKTLFKKLLGIILPITAFVYLGFEHSIANMFFIPLGLSFSSQSFASSTSLFTNNIIPVTLGNIIGGFFISSFLVIFYRAKVYSL